MDSSVQPDTICPVGGSTIAVQSLLASYIIAVNSFEAVTYRRLWAIVMASQFALLTEAVSHQSTAGGLSHWL